MLKFEKNKSYSLRFAEKPRMFTKSFAIAFCIASSIHLAAFFLFKITPLLTKDSKLVFNPVKAEADLSDSLFTQANTDVGSFSKKYKNIPNLPEYRSQPLYDSQFLTREDP